MSIAGFVGFLAAFPLGRLADRFGPQRICRGLLIAEALASPGFLICSAMWQVAIVASIVAACSQGGVGVASALVTGLAHEDRRVDALARIRAWSHAGNAIGAALAAVVIAVGSRAAYDAAIGLNAATFAIYAIEMRHVPETRSQPLTSGSAILDLGALRDLPFATLAAICGVLTLSWGLMSTGLPLWIADDTHAPTALTAVIVFCSAAAIALGQVAFSRGSDTPPAAVRAARRSGASLAACCILLALASGPATLPATGLLLCAGVAHILGELWFVAASRGLSVPLMNPHRSAEYQSVFAAGEALAIMLAPAMMTAIIILNHTARWLGLALAFAVAGAAARPTLKWAEHRRAIPPP